MAQLNSGCCDSSRLVLKLSTQIMGVRKQIETLKILTALNPNLTAALMIPILEQIVGTEDDNPAPLQGFQIPATTTVTAIPTESRTIPPTTDGVPKNPQTNGDPSLLSRKDRKELRRQRRIIRQQMRLARTSDQPMEGAEEMTQEVPAQTAVDSNELDIIEISSDEEGNSKNDTQQQPPPPQQQQQQKPQTKVRKSVPAPNANTSTMTSVTFDPVKGKVPAPVRMSPAYWKRMEAWRKEAKALIHSEGKAHECLACNKCMWNLTDALHHVKIVHSKNLLLPNPKHTPQSSSLTSRKVTNKNSLLDQPSFEQQSISNVSDNSTLNNEQGHDPKVEGSPNSITLERMKLADNFIEAWTVDGVKQFSCKICQRSLAHAWNARLHVCRVHQGLRYHCSSCSKPFYGRVKLAEHLKNCKVGSSKLKIGGDGLSLAMARHLTEMRARAASRLEGKNLNLEDGSSDLLSDVPTCEVEVTSVCNAFPNFDLAEATSCQVWIRRLNPNEIISLSRPNKRKNENNSNKESSTTKIVRQLRNRVNVNSEKMSAGDSNVGTCNEQQKDLNKSDENSQSGLRVIKIDPEYQNLSDFFMQSGK